MKNLHILFAFLALVLSAQQSWAGVAFPEPPGGWTYIYSGDKATNAAPGEGFLSLDGTWSHDNGSDEWDGSAPGGTFGDTNRPGGAGTFDEGGIKFLRIQDTGDPRDFGFTDPGSNRKIYLGHDISGEGASDTVLDDGITLSFRARIPTRGKSTSPIDDLHRDGQQAGGVLPYPAAGDGYVTSDAGKGNFVIKQGAGGAIAFSLSTLNDNGQGDPNGPKANFAGLTMNEFAGNALSGNVNFGQGTGTNVVAFDPTDWHEVWIVIRKDPANIGTHQGYIYIDGSLTPTVFKLTAGTGSDFGPSYIAIGSTATPQNSALDIDFVAYKLGANFPPGFAEPPGGWTYIYHGDKATNAPPGEGFLSLDGTWSHDNGSDEWDGSAPGGTFGDTNRPGGAGTFDEGGVKFLRIQDTGDPRDFGYADPGSNRKIYLGHDISGEGASDTVLDDGITLSFRARIPTRGKSTSPLDDLHRDGQQAGGVLPYPSEGDGYVTSDAGKGNFVIKQGAGGAIAFSLSTQNDNGQGDPNGPKANFRGLTMNEFAGNALSGNVNFGQGTGTNVVALDPTDWHTFWIVLRKDPANIGTHQGYVYVDGSFSPTVFKLTAGTGTDFGPSYIAIGSTATPQNSALDIDYISYKLGAVFPSGGEDNLPPEVLGFQPLPDSMFYSASQGFSFTATTVANNSIPTNGFLLALNGRDVSSDLVISGTDQNRTAKYQKLQTNTLYRAVIIVSDQAGRKSTNNFGFDTFVEAASVNIEAEDYNYLQGEFIDGVGAGGYAEQVGTLDVDFYNNTDVLGATADHIYRSSDAMNTQNSADLRRQKYVDAALQEVHAALIQTNEWLNYTRTVPSARYNVYLRVASLAAQKVQLDRVTGNRRQPNQTTSPLGSFNVPATGSGSAFTLIPLVDGNGAVAALDLSGVVTFRLTALSANNNMNLNYFIFVPAPAVTETPPASVTLTSASISGNTFSFSFASQAGKSYRVEYKSSLSAANWTTHSTINNASAGSQTVTDTLSGQTQRFYRVQSQ